MKKEKPKTAEVRIESDGTLIIAVEGLDRILRVMVEQGKRCKMFYTDASTDLSGFIGDSKDSLCEGCENGGFYDARTADGLIPQGYACVMEDLSKTVTGTALTEKGENDEN